jgi:hypothetical protein
MSKVPAIDSAFRLPIPLRYKILASLANLLGPKQTFHIVVTGPDYELRSYFWGLYKREKGQKFEFTIRGTERFAEIVITGLMKKGLRADADYEQLPR